MTRAYPATTRPALALVLGPATAVAHATAHQQARPLAGPSDFGHDQKPDAGALGLRTGSEHALALRAPQLEHHVGLFDTHTMPYLVEQGRHATRQLLSAIFVQLERKPHLVAA